MSWLRSRPSTKRFIPVPPNPEREYQIRRFHTVWPISWHSLFADAVENIQRLLPEDADDRRYIRAAQSSATDNASRGRASRRLSEFIATMEYSREARCGFR